MDLKQMLRTEFAQRRGRNARYSLRAFARDLGTDHATLSQILRDRRGLSSRMIHRFGERFDLPCSLLIEACVLQDAETILRLASKPAFRTHSRWIATRTGISVDAVNIALQRLLRRGNLVMRATDHWHINRTTHAESRHPLADRFS